MLHSLVRRGLVEPLPRRTVFPVPTDLETIVLVDDENIRLALGPENLALDYQRLADELRSHTPAGKVVGFAIGRARFDDYTLHEFAGGSVAICEKSAAKAGTNVDVEIALYATTEMPLGTEAVIVVSGDGDFLPLVQVLDGQRRSVGVLSVPGSSSRRLRAYLGDRHAWLGLDVLQRLRAPRAVRS